MQKREFKDAMREMSEHFVTKIQIHVNEVIQFNKENGDRILELNTVGMDMDHPKNVLFVILQRLLKDFGPRNNKYAGMEAKLLEFFGLKIDEPSGTQEKKTQRSSKDRLAKAKKPEADKAGTKDTTE